MNIISKCIVYHGFDGLLWLKDFRHLFLVNKEISEIVMDVMILKGKKGFRLLFPSFIQIIRNPSVNVSKRLHPCMNCPYTRTKRIFCYKCLQKKTIDVSDAVDYVRTDSDYKVMTTVYDDYDYNGGTFVTDPVFYSLYSLKQRQELRKQGIRVPYSIYKDDLESFKRIAIEVMENDYIQDLYPSASDTEYGNYGNPDEYSVVSSDNDDDFF
jgi:hypothetical protein